MSSPASSRKAKFNSNKKESSEAITMGLGSVKVAYRWKIANFDMQLKDERASVPRIQSPKFAVCNDSNLFRLTVYPRMGRSEEARRICLTLNPQQDLNFHAKVAIFILDKHGEKVLYSSDQFLRPGMQKGVSPSFVMISHDKLTTDKSILHKGTLTVLCEIDLDDVTRVKKNDFSGCNERLKEFDEFEDLLTNNTFSDFTFDVGKRKFHVHKAIVAIKSKVFSDIFKVKKENSDENTAKLENITCSIFEDLLRFVYTGKVNNMKESAMDLFIAADRYAISGLKIQCEEFLIQTLNSDNVMQHLSTASLLKANRLKSESIKYIASHAEDVTNQPNFNMNDLEKDVITDIVRALANKKVKTCNDQSK